jgi:hypothetical protein
MKPMHFVTVAGAILLATAAHAAAPAAEPQATNAVLKWILDLHIGVVAVVLLAITLVGSAGIGRLVFQSALGSSSPSAASSKGMTIMALAALVFVGLSAYAIYLHGGANKEASQATAPESGGDQSAPGSGAPNNDGTGDVDF